MINCFFCICCVGWNFISTCLLYTITIERFCRINKLTLHLKTGVNVCIKSIFTFVMDK